MLAAVGAAGPESGEGPPRFRLRGVSLRWDRGIPRPAGASEDTSLYSGLLCRTHWNCRMPVLAELLLCPRESGQKDAVWVSRPRGFIPFPLIPVCRPCFPGPLPLCFFLPPPPSLSLFQQKFRELHSLAGEWSTRPSLRTLATSPCPPRSHCGSRCQWELSKLHTLGSQSVRGVSGAALGCVSQVSFVPRLSVGRRGGGRSLCALPLRVDSLCHTGAETGVSWENKGPISDMAQRVPCTPGVPSCSGRADSVSRASLPRL